MYKISYCLVFLLFISFSCKEKGFIKDVPKSDVAPRRGNKPSWYEVYQMLSDSLKIGRIDNGFDSLQIRIWVGSAFSHNKVAVFTCSAGNWSSSLITFIPHYFNEGHFNENRDSVVYFETNSIAPAKPINWPEFIEKLYDCDIMKLPDQQYLKGYDHPTDGVGYTIEIATINKYRLYSYHSPEVNTQVNEARKMNEILKLVKKYTGYHLLDYPKWFEKKADSTE